MFHGHSPSWPNIGSDASTSIWCGNNLRRFQFAKVSITQSAVNPLFRKCVSRVQLPYWLYKPTGGLRLTFLPLYPLVVGDTRLGNPNKHYQASGNHSVSTSLSFTAASVSTASMPRLTQHRKPLSRSHFYARYPHFLQHFGKSAWWTLKGHEMLWGDQHHRCPTGASRAEKT